MPKGIYKHRKGIKFSEERRKKISKAMTKNPKNRFYKDGRSYQEGYFKYMGMISKIRARSKSKKFELIGEFSFHQWQELLEKYKFTCPSCKRKEPEISLGADHIVPFSKGGTNFIENIQPLCRSCNSSKRMNIIKYEI